MPEEYNLDRLQAEKEIEIQEYVKQANELKLVIDEYK